MTPERHQEICDLVYQVLGLDANERGPFLDRVCSADNSLRQEVDSLLSSSEDVRANFLRSSTRRLALEPGTKLGDYEVESMLGSGGMGEVYRARDLRLARDVAIKILPQYLSSNRKQLWRFEQEARAVAALNHPNILAVFQMGEREGVPYMVSELLEGETLRDRLANGPLPVDKAVSFAAQIGRGLTAAHERGIVHRDLKPENLFVTKDGRVKILDFGLAKLTEPSRKQEPATESGAVMGTLGYMSPEQARGQTADARSDIFALGVVLYEMLSGRRAFQRQNTADTLSAILNEDPPPISQVVSNVPLALRRIVCRCLQKKPEDRFQCASDVVRELETSVSHPGRSILREFALALAVAIVVVVILIERKGLLDWAHVILRGPSPSGKTKQSLVEKNLTANLQDNPVTAAAISRDGKYVAYNDKSKKMHLLLVDSGDVHSLSLDSSYEPVDWFPDGVHLLVKRIRGAPGLWTFSTWDSSMQRLWEGPLPSVGSSVVRDAGVSPEGSHVAFIKGADRREIWVMGAGGEEPHKIVEFSAQDSLGNIVWAPNGRRLGYIRARGTFAKHESVIETCDLAGNTRTVFSEPRLWGRDGFGAMAWLASGRIVYSPAINMDEYNLWSIMVDSEGAVPIGKPEPLTDWKDIAAPGFQATADGKRIIVLKSHSEDAVYVGVLQPGAQGFNVKRLMADSWRNAAKSWTKDSKSILLYSERSGKYTICKQDISTGAPEILVAGPENYRDPVASVTGRLLYTALGSADSPGNRRLMSTPIEGGPRSVLITAPHSFTYQCAFAGSGPCVMADLEDNQIVFSTLDPAQGKGGEMARIPYHAKDVAHWSLSPDGSRIAMVETGGESSEIKILSLEDRRITSLRVRAWRWKYLTGIAWAADGKRFFAIAGSDASSALISIDPTGKLMVLHEVDPGRAWLGIPIASPDGRYLAFTKRTYVSDLVILENF